MRHVCGDERCRAFLHSALETARQPTLVAVDLQVPYLGGLPLEELLLAPFMNQHKKVLRDSLLSVSRCVVLTFAFMIAAQQSYARVELAPCKNNYTPAQQIELGDKVAQQVYKEMPVLSDSSPATQYIRQLGMRLAAEAPGYKWPYNFHVTDVAEVNAFALPGGTVFVNLGAIQAAENESQLAGVMAHELSHVVLQHSVCNASKQRDVGIIAGIGQLAATVLLGGTAGRVASEGIGMTAGLGFLKMSRADEKQADLEGVGILYDAGFDPRGLPEFFKIVEAKYGTGGAQFLSDHPNPGNRMEYLDKEIADFVPRANTVVSTPAFVSIKREVANLRAYTSKEVSSGAWKTQAPSQTVGAGANQLARETGAQEQSPGGDQNTPETWKPFRGNGFRIEVPGNWSGYGNQVAAMLAPPGGISRSSNGRRAGDVIYGLLTDSYTPQQGMNLSAALDSLVSSLANQNPGLESGAQSALTIHGITARSIECSNPAGNNGAGERDWIVAFQQSDRAVRYFVFVAPAPDFEKFRPTFARILNTLVLA
jgi:Zn-dependent protease with chaperone function